MIRRIFIVFLAVVLILGLTPVAVGQPVVNPNTPNIRGIFSGHNLDSVAPIRVIVELFEEPAAALIYRERHAGRVLDAAAQSRHEEALRRRHRDILREAGLRGVALHQLRDYTLVLNGFVADVPGNLIERLAQVPGVMAVWPDVPVQAHDLTRSTLNIRTPAALGLPGNFDGSGVVVSVLDTGVD